MNPENPELETNQQPTNSDHTEETTDRIAQTDEQPDTAQQSGQDADKEPALCAADDTEDLATPDSPLCEPPIVQTDTSFYESLSKEGYDPEQNNDAPQNSMDEAPVQNQMDEKPADEASPSAPGEDDNAQTNPEDRQEDTYEPTEPEIHTDFAELNSYDVPMNEGQDGDNYTGVSDVKNIEEPPIFNDAHTEPEMKEENDNKMNLPAPMLTSNTNDIEDGEIETSKEINYDTDLESRLRVFCRQVPKQASEDDIKSAFSCFGPVDNVIIPLDPYTKKRRGFVYVTFKKEESKEQAISVGSCEVLGSVVDIVAAKPRSRDVPITSRIFVRGLPSDSTESDLREFFSRYGEVITFILPKDKNTGGIRNFCFVTFKTPEQTDAFLSSSPFKYKNCELTATFAKSKHDLEKERNSKYGTGEDQSQRSTSHERSRDHHDDDHRRDYDRRDDYRRDYDRRDDYRRDDYRRDDYRRDDYRRDYHDYDRPPSDYRDYDRDYHSSYSRGGYSLHPEDQPRYDSYRDASYEPTQPDMSYNSAPSAYPSRPASSSVYDPSKPVPSSMMYQPEYPPRNGPSSNYYDDYNSYARPSSYDPMANPMRSSPMNPDYRYMENSYNYPPSGPMGQPAPLPPPPSSSYDYRGNDSYGHSYPPGPSRAFIAGLDTSITAEELQSHFNRYGHVTAVHIPDSKKGPGKADFALITFDTWEEVERAIRESPRFVNGKRIKDICIARAKESEKSKYGPSRYHEHRRDYYSKPYSR